MAGFFLYRTYNVSKIGDNQPKLKVTMQTSQKTQMEASFLWLGSWCTMVVHKNYRSRIFFLAFISMRNDIRSKNKPLENIFD